MEVIYSSSAFLYLINPVTTFTDTGQLELLLFVFIPGTDPKQPIDYFVNLCYQLMMLFFGLAGTCCSDIYCFTTVTQLRPMQQIFRQSIRELNEILLKSPYSETILVKTHLRNLLLIHKDIKMLVGREVKLYFSFYIFHIFSFTNNVKRIFSSICIGELYGNALGIIACIYSILTVRN